MGSEPKVPHTSDSRVGFLTCPCCAMHSAHPLPPRTVSRLTAFFCHPEPALSAGEGSHRTRSPCQTSPLPLRRLCSLCGKPFSFLPDLSLATSHSSLATKSNYSRTYAKIMSGGCLPQNMSSRNSRVFTGHVNYIVK